MKAISIQGARQHNLRNLSLSIPRNSLTVVTGLSGSGKSSLAFDTLFAEGQRRYIESLSTYARQFLEQMEKPDVDLVEGLSPAIAIEQKTTSGGARSTVGTITEIYDYLRLLYSSVGHPHCPECGREVTRQSSEAIVERILDIPEATRLSILAPVVRGRKGEYRKLYEQYIKEGFMRARTDGSVHLLEEPPGLDRQQSHNIEIVVDRLAVSEKHRQRIAISVKHALQIGDGLVIAALDGGEDLLFSEILACPDCGINIPILEPRSFSFNSRFGSCPKCRGIGHSLQVNLERLIANPSAPCAKLELTLEDRNLNSLFQTSVSALLTHLRVAPETPFDQAPEELNLALVNGISGKIRFNYEGVSYDSRFDGLTAWFLGKMDSTNSRGRKQQLREFMIEADCSACHGSRLRPESRAVKIGGLSISDYCRMPLKESLERFSRLSLSAREKLVADPVLKEVLERSRFLVTVGLDYLSLDRRAETLSAGEAQRVRLATQVGTRLQGVLYVLDEPSIGLHPRDTRRLISSLAELRNLGNTVVVVEHDEETIRAADYLIDLGPGAGSMGGDLIASGQVEDLEKCEASLTGAYLSGRKKSTVISRNKRGNGKFLEVLGAEHHNLKNIDVKFPLGKLISVTGVSGAGKSSLVDEVVYRALSRHMYKSLAEPGKFREMTGLDFIDKVIEIDQSPIGRTPRSNPATYCGVFTPVRELFSILPEAKLRGFKPGRFSFNVKGGRCETCGGEGQRRIEMNFLPDVYVHCEACAGSRYNRETLAVKYKGHSIADVLALTVEEAFELLESIPPIKAKLKALLDVGLGYISLGQSSTTLSGGEAQRVKLARELSRRSTGSTFYILDEPTTGLHFEDVRNLLNILHRLADLGNTVVIIEHNLDILRSSDWIIDLGPEGGDEGGYIVAEGPPDDVMRVAKSYTGRALKNK